MTSIAKAVAGATLRAAYESLSQAEDSDGADEDDDDGGDDEGSGKSDQELHAFVYLRVYLCLNLYLCAHLYYSILIVILMTRSCTCLRR